MQTMHIEGILYVEGNVTWNDPLGLPLNVYAKGNVVAYCKDKKPSNLEPGDVYVTGNLVVQGQVAVDENIGTPDAYAPEAETESLLRSGAAFRRARIACADMISTEEAAEIAGTSRVTVYSWIMSGRVIGLKHLVRGFKLPQWQFEPEMFPMIQEIAHSLQTTDGWMLLNFLETSSPALGGLMPRAAIDQGVPKERILAAAVAYNH